MTEPVDHGPSSPLAAALAAVQQALPDVRKDKTGDAGSYKYNYADLAAVSAAILPVLGRNGLAFVAFPTINGDGKFVLRYQLLHTAGETLTGEYPLSGGNAQAIGSSITYARRYCLCSVTGVAPDDDDDAAGAMGHQEVQRDAARQEKVAQDSQEYTQAIAAVQGAWANHVGAWDAAAAGKAFHAWSRGGVLRDAEAEALRGFAQWLTDQPVQDAGAPPAADQAPPAQQPAYRGVKDPDAEMSGRQRGALFALLGEIGLDNQVDQLRWVNQQLKTEYESRKQITAGNADLLITALKAGDVPAQSERAQ